jgi:glycosyltransferase involved in cell wall biosynthesis
VNGSAHGGRAPAISFLSPLPPEPSGVADHSGRLLPGLAERLEIQAYTLDPQRSAAATRCGMPLHGYGDFTPSARRIPVYQIGNHAAHHGAVYRIAMRWPGVVVLHEYVLHDLVRECALADGGPRAYADELRYCLGHTGERLAAGLRLGGERLAPHAWPLFERLVDSSLAVVVHSRAARDRIARSRPLALLRVVPLLLPPPPRDPAGAAAELRRELEIPQDTLVLGAFGVAAAAKRIDVVLRAFERLSRTVTDSVLILAGPETTRFLRERGGLPDAIAGRVRLLDRLPLDRLQAAMAATDVAFNLRFPTGGETSDTCLRLMALGRPVVVSAAGWFDEIPRDACVQVRPDALEEPTIDALVGALAAQPALRRAIGDNARRWALAEHAAERVVEGYVQAVAAAAERRSAPRSAAPPPPAPDDLDAEALCDVAAALGDLGVTEADADALATVARAAASLGLGEPADPPARSRGVHPSAPGRGATAEESP